MPDTAARKENIGSPSVELEDAPFEWITDNEAIYHDLAAAFRFVQQKRLEQSGQVLDAKISLASLGCGTSRLDAVQEKLAAEFAVPLTVAGLDIDLPQLQRNVERRPQDEWWHCDLGDPDAKRKAVRVLGCCSPDAQPSACGDATQGGLGRFDVILDKGTLDYLICEEPEAFVHYLRNLRQLMIEPDSVYVLVSFRDRDLLLRLLSIVGLVLLKLDGAHEAGMRPLGDTRQCGICYLFVGAGPIELDAFGSELVTVRAALDEYYAQEPLLNMQSPTLDDSSSSSRVQSQNGQTSDTIALGGEVTLAEAYAELIPSDLQAEYSYEFFLQDLRETLPSAAARGKMTRDVDFAEYLRLNQ